MGLYVRNIVALFSIPAHVPAALALSTGLRGEVGVADEVHVELLAAAACAAALEWVE